MFKSLKINVVVKFDSKEFSQKCLFTSKLSPTIGQRLQRPKSPRIMSLYIVNAGRSFVSESNIFHVQLKIEKTRVKMRRNLFFIAQLNDEKW